MTRIITYNDTGHYFFWVTKIPSYGIKKWATMKTNSTGSSLCEKWRLFPEKLWKK